MVYTEETRMLWASIALGLVQLFAAMVAGLVSGRMFWNLGPRDEEGPKLGKIAARIERAWRNYLETFPLFAAVVLLATALGKHNTLTTLGAELFVYSRVVHVVLYAIGVPVVRTIVFTVSLVGIVLVLLGVWPG
jgi:uncharacterized MAPEG superfamily protein